MRRHHAFALMFVVAVFASAQSLPLGLRSTREPSRAVVGKYCRMDYQGFRLTKDTWPRLKAVTTWKDNPDWQGFTVISQYELLEVDEGLRAAAVSVRYNVVGRFEIGLGYVPDRASEQVNFVLKEEEGDWKIDKQDPPINPHVSKIQAIAWLKSTLATEKDSANRITIAKAIQDLGGTR